MSASGLLFFFGPLGDDKLRASEIQATYGRVGRFRAARKETTPLPKYQHLGHRRRTLGVHSRVELRSRHAKKLSVVGACNQHHVGAASTSREQEVHLLSA